MSFTHPPSARAPANTRNVHPDTAWLTSTNSRPYLQLKQAWAKCFKHRSGMTDRNRSRLKLTTALEHIIPKVGMGVTSTPFFACPPGVIQIAEQLSFNPCFWTVSMHVPPHLRSGLSLPYLAMASAYVMRGSGRGTCTAEAAAAEQQGVHPPTQGSVHSSHGATPNHSYLAAVKPHELASIHAAAATMEVPSRKAYAMSLSGHTPFVLDHLLHHPCVHTPAGPSAPHCCITQVAQRECWLATEGTS